MKDALQQCAVWLATSLCLSAPALACAEGDACHIDEGSYRIALPEDRGTPIPALVYLHGYAASGAAALAREDITGPYLARGYAVIAPDGQIDRLQGSNLDWGVADRLDRSRDDIAFVRAVIADGVRRFGIDPDRIVLAGYSRGASMVWDIACHAPDTATAYATHAGGFWAPLLDRCAAPVRLFHSHGFLDATVPLEGNRIVWFDHPMEMGDVWSGLAVWRETMDCPLRVRESKDEGGVWIKRWTACDGGDLTLELVAGGHERRSDWPARVLDWFDRADPSD